MVIHRHATDHIWQSIDKQKAIKYVQTRSDYFYIPYKKLPTGRQTNNKSEITSKEIQ